MTSYLYAALFAAVLYLSAYRCPAQTTTFYSDHIGTANGLSYDKVRDILQDKEGFIWIATWNGLNRYDGHRFITFYHKPGDSTSLPDNRVQKLYEDAKGNLWVCTWSGVSRYNPVTDRFENFFQKKTQSTIKPLACYAIAELKNDYWVGTNNGLRKINFVNRSLDYFPGKPADDFINIQVIFSLFPSVNGYLLAASFAGVLKIQTDQNEYERIVLNDGIKKHFKPDNQVNKIIEENDSTWWLGTWSGGLKKLNPYTGEFFTYLPEDNIAYTYTHNIIRQIIPLNNRYLLTAGSDDGFKRFDKTTSRFENFYNYNPGNIAVNPGPVFVIYKDRQGRVWMGNDGGIFIVDPAKQFIQQKKIYWLPDRDCNKTITCIYRDPTDTTNNQYWVSTDACGIFLTDSLLQNIQNTESSRLLNTFAFKKKFTATDLFRDKNDLLWIACGPRGLLMIDEKKRKILHWGNALPGIKTIPGFEGMYIKKLLGDESGMLWLATSRGLFCLDPVSNNIKPFPHPVLGKENIQYLEDDTSGNHWAVRYCNDNGEPMLYRINKKDKNVTAFSPAVLQKISCSGQNGIFTFIIDQDNSLWFTDPDAFLVRGTVINDSLITKTFTTKDGMPPYRINVVREADDMRLWLATSNGILLFNKQTEKVETAFTSHDGLLEADITYIYNDPVARLFVRANRGLYNIVRCPPPTTSEQNPPNVVITGIRTFNKPYLDKSVSITQLKKLVLDYRQNNLQIDFAALDYTNPEQQIFAYKLEGIDSNWIYTRQPTAIYNKLEPGNYTLLVRAANSNKVWNETGVYLKLEISPPFSQTLWFRLLLAAAVTLLVFWLVKYRIAAVRKEEKLKQLKTEAEMKALRAQMNPHFIFNCMNTIDAYILKNKQEEASDILQKFSQLIRLALENSRHDFVTIEEDMKALELYVQLEEYILGNCFEYSLDIEHSLLQNPYCIPPMLLQPYAENAIVHGLRHLKKGKGRLIISIRLIDNFIYCTIEDNGIGRKQSGMLNKTNLLKKESLGMKVTEDRIENLNRITKKKITINIEDIKDGDKSGTLVKIQIPAVLIKEKSVI